MRQCTHPDTHMSPRVHTGGQEESDRMLAESGNVTPQCGPATLEQTLKQTALQVSLLSLEHLVVQENINCLHDVKSNNYCVTTVCCCTVSLRLCRVTTIS